MFWRCRQLPKTCVRCMPPLQVGEELKSMPGSDGTNPYAAMVEDAEGLDKIEALQQHQNEDVYVKAVHMLEAFFDIEGEEVREA